MLAAFEEEARLLMLYGKDTLLFFFSLSNPEAQEGLLMNRDVSSILDS